VGSEASGLGAVEITRLPVPLLSRSGRIFWYCGERYQPSAAARDGNSTITVRGHGHAPSSTVSLPPRTMNLPPWAAMVGITCLRYSAKVASSLMSSCTTTYALMGFLSCSV
jgi:hypothetical protein